jgi:hypothetical protein
MGNSSEFSLDMNRLRTDGMSTEEAWWQTFTDYVERVVDTGARSGRYGLITGLTEYGGEYFQQHPEAFDALVNGRADWTGGTQELPPGGVLVLPGLPQGTDNGSDTSGMPMLPGPAAGKDDWETAIEEAVAEWDIIDLEDVDISGESGTMIGGGIGGTNGQVVLLDPTAEGSISVEGAGNVVIDSVLTTRVGQWMSKTEYERFLKTGEIPRTNVLMKGMDGYIKQANKGDYYVEFDIDPSLLVPKNEELGWALVKPKNQIYIKLYQNKGLTLPDPTGTNIIHVYTK